MLASSFASTPQNQDAELTPFSLSREHPLTPRIFVDFMEGGRGPQERSHPGPSWTDTLQLPQPSPFLLSVPSLKRVPSCPVPTAPLYPLPTPTSTATVLCYHSPCAPSGPEQT